MMTSLLDYAPVAAACCAVPQFLPQIRKLAATGDTSGLSWSWVALTAVNNAAWIAYFTLAVYPTALIPSSSVTLLAGTLAVMLTGQPALWPIDDLVREARKPNRRQRPRRMQRASLAGRL